MALRPWRTSESANHDGSEDGDTSASTSEDERGLADGAELPRLLRVLPQAAVPGMIGLLMPLLLLIRDDANESAAGSRDADLPALVEAAPPEVLVAGSGDGVGWA